MKLPILLALLSILTSHSLNAATCPSSLVGKLPTPPNAQKGTSECITRIYLDNLTPKAARDFYQAYFQKQGWDVANPHGPDDALGFTIRKKKRYVNVDFFAIGENGSGTRLEITE